MLDREDKKPVRSSAILQMLGKKEEEQEDRLLTVEMTDEQFGDLAEKVNSSREKNPRAYERYRGTGNTKAMSYYLSDELIMGIALKSALESKDKSEIVREALTVYLQEELEQVERLKERGK